MIPWVGMSALKPGYLTIFTLSREEVINRRLQVCLGIGIRFWRGHSHIEKLPYIRVFSRQQINLLAIEVKRNTLTHPRVHDGIEQPSKQWSLH
jgi:hypothetical protein